jgi:hypothetical protein
LGATIGLTLVVVRVRRGAARQQGHGGSDNNQTTRGEHEELLLFDSVMQGPSALAGVGSFPGLKIPAVTN